MYIEKNWHFVDEKCKSWARVKGWRWNSESCGSKEAKECERGSEDQVVVDEERRRGGGGAWFKYSRPSQLSFPMN